MEQEFENLPTHLKNPVIRTTAAFALITTLPDLSDEEQIISIEDLARDPYLTEEEREICRNVFSIIIAELEKQKNSCIWDILSTLHEEINIPEHTHFFTSREIEVSVEGGYEYYTPFEFVSKKLLSNNFSDIWRVI